MELLHVKSPDIMSALATYIQKVRIPLQQFYTPRKKVYSNSVEPVTKRSFGKVPNLVNVNAVEVTFIRGC